MADTINLIPITEDWQDMYALTGITVGTAVDIITYNRGDSAALSQSAAEPASNDIMVPIRSELGTVRLTSGASGFWARTGKRNGIKLSIQEVV